MRIGYFLASEEFTPAQLLEQGETAAAAGFQALWISDHYHPWIDAQGQSGFVWSMIGALSQVSRLPITTAVTCPTMRIHPAVIAQAAATSAVLCEGRFVLGVGSGEALNEHIFGDPWPAAAVRLEMLEEAVELMRRLWTGEMTSFRGEHYRVENAQLYTLPAEPPPIYVSGFGRRSIELAGRVGDGYITTAPDTDAVAQFRAAGGEGKPAQGSFKAAYAPTEQEAVRVAHQRWPVTGLPGELPQLLPSPRHFEQASTLVTPQMVRSAVVCGDNPDAHLKKIETYRQAGFDEVYVASIGPHWQDFFTMYAERVLPQLRS